MHRDPNIAHTVGYFGIGLYMAFVAYIFSQPDVHAPVSAIYAVWVLTIACWVMAGFHWSRVWDRMFAEDNDVRKSHLTLRAAQRRLLLARRRDAE